MTSERMLGSISDYASAFQMVTTGVKTLGHRICVSQRNEITAVSFQDRNSQPQVNSLFREWGKFKHTGKQVRKKGVLRKIYLKQMNRNDQMSRAATALPLTQLCENSRNLMVFDWSPLATGITAIAFFREKKKKMDKGENSALFPITVQGVKHRIRKEKPHKSRGFGPTSVLSQGSNFSSKDLAVMWKL